MVKSAIDTLPELLAALTRSSALLELALLLACLALAWALCAALRPRHQQAHPGAGIWFGKKGIDGALFPLLALALALLARLLMRGQLPVAVFQLAVPVLASLALIRVVVRVLHAAYPESALVRALARAAGRLPMDGSPAAAAISAAISAACTASAISASCCWIA